MPESSAEIGLLPETTAASQTAEAPKKEGFLAKLGKIFDRATNISQADAVATMPRPGMPENVAQGMATEMRKTEQPVSPTPAQPTTK